MKTTHFLKEAITSGGPVTRKAAAMELLLHMDHYLPWLAAREFAGINLIHKEGEWLLVLKSWRKKQPQVTFFASDDLEDVFHLMAYALLWDLELWHEDKWRTTRSDKD